MAHLSEQPPSAHQLIEDHPPTQLEALYGDTWYSCVVVKEVPAGKKVLFTKDQSTMVIPSQDTCTHLRARLSDEPSGEERAVGSSTDSASGSPSSTTFVETIVEESIWRDPSTQTLGVVIVYECDASGEPSITVMEDMLGLRRGDTLLAWKELSHQSSNQPWIDVNDGQTARKLDTYSSFDRIRQSRAPGIAFRVHRRTSSVTGSEPDRHSETNLGAFQGIDGDALGCSSDFSVEEGETLHVQRPRRQLQTSRFVGVSLRTRLGWRVEIMAC